MPDKLQTSKISRISATVSMESVCKSSKLINDATCGVLGHHSKICRTVGVAVSWTVGVFCEVQSEPMKVKGTADDCKQKQLASS